ncbi:MAG TPA: zinc ABC transporter substrate-binding protein [Pseudogracilibacillus sp.]|nr:zinc ABC transporter substrate-binding protein [Pseudogracilibacillus sp.]
MKKFIPLLLIFVILSACQSNASEDDNKIFTSIYPLQYVTKEIAGDTAEVTSMYPPGVDAHTYEPTTKQLTELAKSELFVYLGAGMEGFAEHAAEALADTNVQFLEIGENEALFIEGDEEEDHDHGHSHDVDPHIWLDPLRMIQVGEMVTQQLSNLHPEHTDIYEENFKNFEKDMLALHEAYEEILEDKTNKKMIVTHAAYGYWEARYKLEQIPISGISSSDEPSQKDLVTLIKEAKELDLNYIVFEKNSSNRVGEIIQEHLQAEAVYIHNLETLTEDDVEHGRNYISIMQENLEVLDKITN